MYKIYKAYRDAEYMAREGHDRASVLGAIVRAFRTHRFLRKACRDGYHIRLDVWGERCWHQRLEDKIEQLDQRRVWGNPDIEWAPLPEDHPVREAGISSGHFRRKDESIDYHPWRSGP